MFSAVRGRILSFLRVKNLKQVSIRSTVLPERNPKVVHLTIIGPSGRQYQVQGNVDWSLMETIQKNNLPDEFQDFGICFGTSFCKTCHVYLEEEDSTKIPPPEEDSDELFYLEEETPNYIPSSSRLACQVKLRSYMQNMKIQVPEKCLGSREIPP